ncbi:MAG: hypothetical protein M3463_13940 [Verrucomicrobiota bacterium]|nr:hypothetical protein [Verrucomicrobiota bacterium]
MKSKPLVALTSLLFIAAVLTCVLIWNHQTSTTGPTRVAEVAAQRAPQANDAASQGAPAAPPADREDASEQIRSIEPPLAASFEQSLFESAEDVRHRRVMELLRAMRPEDAVSLRDVFKKFDQLGMSFHYEWAAFWRRWGEIDPQGALAYLKSQPEQSWVSNGYERIFRGWAARNPDEALQWLRSNPEHQFLEPAFLGLIDGISMTNPRRATELLLGAGEGKSTLTQSAARRIAEQVLRLESPSALIEWYDSLPESEAGKSARAGAIDQVGRLRVNQDPGAALDWIRAQAHAGTYGNGAIRAAAAKMSETNPEAAMRFVQELPINPNSVGGLHSGVQEVVTQWAQTNAPALETWLHANPNSPVFDQAVHDYAVMLNRSNPQRSQYWLEKIRSEYLRTDALKRIAR